MRTVYFEKSIPKVLATIAFKHLSKRAVFSKAAPVRIDTLPTPTLPGKRWVRLRNTLCGICGSDLHLVNVDIDPMVHPAALPSYDRIYLGHEVVSTVVEAGDDVGALALGDRVLMKSRFLGPNCHSQELEEVCGSCAAGNYCLCANGGLGVGPHGVGGGWSDAYTSHETEVWKVPDHLDDEEASLVEPIACGVRAVLRRPPAPGEKVLVVGSGTIGLGTIQALTALFPKAKVYATARYPQQITAARDFGAEILEGDMLDATAKATGARVYTGEFKNRSALGGFDVIYDCVGSASTVETSLRCARAGGAVVIVGISLNKMKIDLTPTWHQEVTLLGSVAHGGETYEGEQISTFDLTARLFEAGALRKDHFITHRFDLEQWKEAVRTSMDKKSGAIKVIFDYR